MVKNKGNNNPFQLKSILLLSEPELLSPGLEPTATSKFPPDSKDHEQGEAQNVHFEHPGYGIGKEFMKAVAENGRALPTHWSASGQGCTILTQAP